MRSRIKKINWKNGSGEILGFCAIIPGLFALMLVLIATIQIGITKQKMEYAAYSACRAAAVSSDETVAQAQASGVADEYLGSLGTINSVNTDIEVIDANGAWQKGHFVKCTITADVVTIMPALFGNINGQKSTSIIMMIENPST